MCWVCVCRVRKILKKTKAATRKPSKKKKRPGKTTTAKSPPAASPKRKARGRATPGTGKRYPTIPTVSRISFDFLHYIRPPPEAKAIPQQGFAQFLGLMMTLDGVSKPGIIIQPNSIWRLRVNLLRSLSHVLYFSCQQVRPTPSSTARLCNVAVPQMCGFRFQLATTVLMRHCKSGIYEKKQFTYEAMDHE